MIRKALESDVERLVPDTEGAARLRALVDAYGLERPFLRIWTDGKGGFASLMDGAAVLSLPRGLDEEWRLFLAMQLEVKSVRGTAEDARRLADTGEWTVSAGAVTAPGSMLGDPETTTETLSPREVFPILTACFGKEALPSFDAWYTDVSHRVRRRLCRLTGVREAGEPVACAMTVAECGAAPCEPAYGGAAVIGAVATLPAARGRGYASACVLTLTRQLMGEGRRVFLSPKNGRAFQLYAGLGFVPCGEWGSAARSTTARPFG